MKKLKKWTAILLTICMTTNGVAIPVSAEGSGAQQSTVQEEVGTENTQTGTTSPESEGTTPVEPEVTTPAETEGTTPVETEGKTPSTETEETTLVEPEGETSSTEPGEDFPPAETEGEFVITEGEGVLPVQEQAVSFLLEKRSLTDPFAQQFAKVLEANGYDPNELIDEIPHADGTTEVTLTVEQGDSQILELLSKQEQSATCNYQNWNIDFNFSGTLTLPNNFEGLGDPGFPFAGQFIRKQQQTMIIQSSQTIFKSLSAEANLDGFQIQWTGDPDKPILTRKLVTDGQEHEINMSLAGTSSFSPYIGEMVLSDSSASGVVTLPSLNYSGANESSDQKRYSGDVGLLCGKMGPGTKLKVTSLICPALVSLSSDKNAGCLVGNMEAGSELLISENLNLTVTIDANLAAGGLVGKINCAKISFEGGKSITVNANLITSPSAAGGVCGEVTTNQDVFSTNANVILQLVNVRSSGENGAVGVCFGVGTITGEVQLFNGITIDSVSTQNIKSKNNGKCGGVFGTLRISGDGKCTISGTENDPVIIKSILTGSIGNETLYGGVVGELSADAEKNALVVKNCDVSVAINFPSGVSNDPPKYLGGIVAVQKENATVDTEKISIDVHNPQTKAATDYGFGGVVSQLGNGALLIADTVAVTTDDYSATVGGGSVVGKSGIGSIVYLKTGLNISQCQLNTHQYSGQIVGYQDCSLIYAPNVNIKRLKTTNGTNTYDGMELDDIGNYGELYRLPGFLTVNGDYSRSLPKLEKKENGYEIKSASDYACFALAWQSRGYFQTITGNWSDLKNTTLSLMGDVDLAGCGIGGLSRDVSSNDDIFSGTIEGNNHKITLDIGTENQDPSFSVSKGDGRIYWHNAPGLFAKLDSKARISNLTLAGGIRVSNNRITGMTTGALAAVLNCTEVQTQPTIDQISTEVQIDAHANGTRIFYAGGLFGNISGDKKAQLNLNGNVKASINVDNNGNGYFVHIGGVIGAIQSDANLEITCNIPKLAGRISYVNSLQNVYAGGLIGTIFPRKQNDSEGNRTINLNSLTIDGFSISANASERMGGILGGIWADTDVVVNELNITNASITANGNAKLGGLVYRASGKWDVKKVNLSGLKITAESAAALGLMVCQGGPYKEIINSDSNYYVDGLYLNMSTDWEKGYIVPSDGNIKHGGAVFDEFVAYTAGNDRLLSEPLNEITTNGSGIISLTTNTGTVSMTDGDRNTYVNRTDIGKNKQTNKFSRYYYNLPSVITACGDIGNSIDTPNELLIWSVYHYAASNLKKYFVIPENLEWKIGGTNEARANFDMNGLSYYPISITNSDVTVQYADITFYNEQIETKEDGNKSTRGTADNHSQHYTMHCGLFLNYLADSGTSVQSLYTMKVTGVKFAGSVGVVNGGSGVLLCGNVNGDTREGKVASCKIILADVEGKEDEDKNSEAVVLNGITVVGSAENGYRPVLINKSGSYAGIEANYLISSEVQNQQEQSAGSSLIGDVGGENAKNVSLVFAGTIKLKEDGMFTRAMLLNSLRYDVGSATYNFNEAQDWNGEEHIHDVTYGCEISTSVEYEGKQKGYYDTQTIISNEVLGQEFDFSAWLPYVYDSPASNDMTHTLENGYHEIKVNVRPIELINGCGTYGHPYIIEDYSQLKAFADCINSGRFVNDWKIRVKCSDEYHSAGGEKDEVLVYNNGWKEDGTENPVENFNMQQYLTNAYYCIVEDLVDEDSTEKSAVKNFPGFGTEENPFKGVIIGKKAGGSSPTLTLEGNTKSLIQYSYGSVVKNLNITLNQTVTLSRETSDAAAPKTFFGGVIGCVLGGDNIIDNVSVSGGKGLAITSASVNKPHLIPKGGYVGVIAGGGVIFRGAISSTTGISGTELYTNPIIGRVLDGYAYYEGEGTEPNNTDKNYTINKINEKSSLNWNSNSNTLTVNNAQGLLILSGIISSGAGSSTTSKAYTKGKVRNASYNAVGEETKPTDFAVVEEDESTTTKTPYLLKNYVQGSPSNLCDGGTGGISVQFAGGTFDMSRYYNGYRGLSARYVSNAVFDQNNVLKPANVVMRVDTFNGGNTDVQNINMNVREYEDDDFHAASLGGIFNIVWTKINSGGSSNGVSSHVFAKDLVLSNCNVSLQYINSENKDVNEAATTFKKEDGRCCVTVGGFIGSVSDVKGTKASIKSNYLLSNIRITGTNNKCTIKGPNSAGGIIGAAAMSTCSGYPGILLYNNQYSRFAPSFLNCSYKYVKIEAIKAAGGLLGYGYADGAHDFVGLGASGEAVYTSCTVTEENFKVGEQSEVITKAKRSVCGGLFGGVGMRVGVNNPDINNLTGLAVLGDSESMKAVCLSDVKIKSYTDGNSSITDGATDGAMAGGVIGRIGSVNITDFYDVQIEGCEISVVNQESGKIDSAGGIVGSGYTNTKMDIQSCKVMNTKISGQYAGGSVGYGYTTPYNLHMNHCKIEGNTIEGKGYAGGIVGYATGSYYFYNILLKNNDIKGPNSSKEGRLFGYTNTTAIQAAGISVFVSPDAASETPEQEIHIPAKDGGNLSDTYTGYIAYADYAGTDAAISSSVFPTEGTMNPELQAAKEVKAPYVPVNPYYILEMNDGTKIPLRGDAVGKIDGDTYNSVAARIWADQINKVDQKKNLVSYKENLVTDEKASTIPIVSTFSAEQGCGPSDLPVLVLGAGDAGVIEDYLNLITNGAYAKKEDVKASAKVYYYDSETGKFYTKQDVEMVNEKPAVWFAAAATDRTPRIRQNSYDNTRNRFTLITAEFKVTVNGTEYTYTVDIPVIVKRELQYNFMSTFSYGTEFKAATFDNLRTHVLENIGNPITAYLTYQYNREKTEYVEYDWQRYMEDGGDMLGVNKVITFSTGLPSGTQLLLVDCQNNNRAYQLTTSGTSVGTETKINLKDFCSVTEPNEKFQVSMADVLGVAAKENTNGKFIIVSKEDKPTVRLNGIYYKAVEEGGAWDLTVPDLSNEENIPNENYFLVVNVPKDSNVELNGNLGGSLDWTMPNNGTWLHRYDLEYEDINIGNNDETTYQISSGYTQSLTTEHESEKINLTNENPKIEVAVKDTITFSSSQVYGDGDQLFLKFTVDLQSHKGENSTTQILPFPPGARGDVRFYIQDVDGTYYYKKSNTWNAATSDKPDDSVAAGKYEWVSQGSNMELLLSEDGIQALDISGVRKIIKDAKKKSEITVSAKFDVYFNGLEMINDVIPTSDSNGVDQWANLYYTAKLSTQEDSLSYSTVRAGLGDPRGYYIGIQNEAVLSMDARYINQLGINPLELVPEYLSDDKESSRIDMIASLSLAQLENSGQIKELLKNTGSITFNLSLERSNSGNYAGVSSAGDYISFDRGMTWTIVQSQYYDTVSDQIITSDLFNGKQFEFPIKAYVKLTKKDYANYKIKLKAQFNSTEGGTSAVNINDTDAYLVYTYACIKPKFYNVN